MKKINKVKNITELLHLVRHDISLNDKIRQKIDLELTTDTLEHTKITYDKTNQNN